MAVEGPLEKRLQKWRKVRADVRLFRHLSRIHDLTTEDMEILTALADHHRLVRLSEIFVRPGLFEDSPDPQRWDFACVQELRRRLTEGTEEAETSEESTVSES